MELSNKIITMVSEATKTDPVKLSADTSFIDDLNLDSLDMVEMMMKLEDEFNIEIPEGDADKMRTIGSVVKYLQNKGVAH